MADLRSGLCHGPDCSWHITARSPSEDFCSDDCQTAWNALHAHPPMQPLSVHLPSPGMARWTPEGGAPVTPETSTWEPRTGVEPVGEWLDEAAGWLEANAGVQLEPWQRTVFAQALQAETETLMVNSTASVTPTLPSSIQEGDQLVVLMDNRTGTFTPAPPKMTVRLVETGEVLFTGPVEPWPEVGEAATQSPTRRSWFSRLWRWMWLRG